MASHSLYNFLRKTLWFKNWPHITSAPSTPTPKLPRPTIFSMAPMNWWIFFCDFFAISPLLRGFNRRGGGVTGTDLDPKHPQSSNLFWVEQKGPQHCCSAHRALCEGPWHDLEIRIRACTTQSLCIGWRVEGLVHALHRAWVLNPQHRACV
jgi:hypothetical protein